MRPVAATADCCGKLIVSGGFFMSRTFAMLMPHLNVGAQKNWGRRWQRGGGLSARDTGSKAARGGRLLYTYAQWSSAQPGGSTAPPAASVRRWPPCM